MVAQPNPARSGHAAPRAVLLDAMGTLLTFEPPAPHLRAELERRLGVDVGPDAARDAIAAEIAYYRAHFDLRRRCAEAMRPALPPPAAAAPGELLTEALLASLRFHAYPDAAPALRRLRDAGVRLVVVSNWDASLHERLAETGLASLVDGAVASAEVGAAKPDPRIFAVALGLAGVDADAAWHVGDSVDADVEGALAAGLHPVLVARDDGADGRLAPAGARVIATLAELPALAEYPPVAPR
jgi:putative hydrolase of the HAD superfamily